MSEGLLAELLERNRRHTESLPADHFSTVQTGQRPAVVSICCSDSRVSQEGMFDVTEPGWLFSPSTIGNQAWDRVDGDRVVDGSVCYPLAMTETKVAAVVGHTGCGAVTAALQTVRGDIDELPSGIKKWVELQVPVVEDGLASERVDADAEPSLVDQLVEYNVDRQVEFLRDSEVATEDVSIYGFVYDFQNVYGDVPGRTYLVNVDGTRSISGMSDLVPEEFHGYVNRLS